MEYLIFITVLLILLETSYLAFSKKRPRSSGKRKIYVDTSALIDGRVLDVARSGFLDGELIILRAVLFELQLLADGKDSDKRARARKGLETALELERVINVNTEIIDSGNNHSGVDNELLRVAKENRGAILTLDYNLIKVAEAEKIETLNINDLAIATRSQFAPGSRTRIKIEEKGSERGQGVGHLDDGTMVVVDSAANKIGKEVLVELIKFHEKSSGRIIFAKLCRK